jgi:hypothetical protein
MDEQKRFGSKSGLLLLIFSLLVLSACEFHPQIIGGNWGETIDVRIYSPEDGSEWPVNTPIEIGSLVSAPEVVQSLTLFVNGQQNREDLFAHPTFTRGTIQQQWTPTRTGEFTLQTILRDAKDEAESNIITIFVVEPTPETLVPFITSTATLTLTPSLTLTPTMTLTPEQGKPEANANENLNCRRGPSILYDVIWYFMKGESAPIVGRTSDNGWLLIERGDGLGECWVGAGIVTVSGDLTKVVIVTPPPLPPTYTPTFTESPYKSCGDYPDMATCSQDPMGFGGCSWDTGLNVCQP